MPSDSAAVQENRLDNTKGMSDEMKKSVRKAAFTICQLKEEGRHEEAEKLSKMVAESMGQLTEPSENDEMRSRMTELGTTTKMIGEHLTTGILKDGQVQIEVSSPILLVGGRRAVFRCFVNPRASCSSAFQCLRHSW